MEKYAIITGASSGIGKAFALNLADKGYNLILVARRKERLEELSRQVKTGCEIIVADLSQAQACYDLYNRVKDKNIEILINNAGFGLYGEFRSTELDRELEMIELNVKALHILTKLFLQDFVKKDAGYILNVASSAGLLPGGPYLSTYYATKAYVTSLTLAIAQELKSINSKVYIGALCPGPVKTEFNKVANTEFAISGITAEECAKYTLKKMQKGKTIIVPAFIMKFVVFAARFLPRATYVKLTAKQQKRRRGEK